MFPDYRIETFDEPELCTWEFPEMDQPAVIAAGQVLRRGAVVGQVTATKQWVLSLAAANDGSQTPKGIMPFRVDATAEAKNAAVYVAGGRFINSSLILGAGHTLDTVHAAFDGKPVFFGDALT